MSWKTGLWTASAMLLLLAACGDKNHDTAPPTEPDDTGPDPTCNEGEILDGDECVPEACGTGPWGDLATDEATVFVDIEAAEGGDGSEGAPFTSIQAGLDAAGGAGGGMVAVADGDYIEHALLESNHAGVHLAGRCQELVILDGSTLSADEPVIGIDAAASEVTVSGVTARDAQLTGISVASGQVTLRDLTVTDSLFIGVAAIKSGIPATDVWMERCTIERNQLSGLYVSDSGATVDVQDSVIRDSLTDGGGYGYGVMVSGGADLTIEGSTLSENTSVGLLAMETGTSVTATSCTIEGTTLLGTASYGAAAQQGASMELESCTLTGNEGAAVLAYHAETVLTMSNCTITDNLHVGGAGAAVAVAEGASLVDEGSVIQGNALVGVSVSASGSTAQLTATEIRDTHEEEDGGYGYGITVSEGSTLEATDLVVVDNANVGILAYDAETLVALDGGSVTGTRPSTAYTASIGVAVQQGAQLQATGLDSSDNEGPGLYAYGADSGISCDDCQLTDNQFANVVVIDSVSLELEESSALDSVAHPDIGGGYGVYVDGTTGGFPTALLADNIISGNLLVGVWLAGEGSYQLTGNTISNSAGDSGSCGDNVFAWEGIDGWDGATGLLLQDNVISDAARAGLLLDGTTATTEGNSFEDNSVDLVLQGDGCEALPEGWSGDYAVEQCPAASYETCTDRFSLY